MAQLLAVFFGGFALGALLAPIVWSAVLSAIVPWLYRAMLRGSP